MKLALALSFLALLATRQTKALEVDDDGYCQGNPDPHFRAWNNIYYDYHGGCDVVLIKNPNANVHLRLEVRPGYSTITSIALEIGGEILEVNANGTAFVNKTFVAAVPATIGGKDIVTTVSTYEIRLDTPSVDPYDGHYIRFSQWYNSMNIQVYAHGSTFVDTVGLCGTWTSPFNRTDRSGMEFTGNDTAYGEHWQVNTTSDGDLFESAGVMECAAPNTGGGQNGEFPNGDTPDEEPFLEVYEAITPMDAKDKCMVEMGDAAMMFPDELKNCIYDLTVTGDPMFAEAPFYMEPLPLQPESRCVDCGDKCAQEYDGECKWKCNEDGLFWCNFKLCGMKNDPEPCEGKTKKSKGSKKSKGAEEEDECGCKIRRRVPYYHNEVLQYVIDNFGPYISKDATDTAVKAFIKKDNHHEIMDGVTDFLIYSIGTHADLTEKVAYAIWELLNNKHLVRKRTCGADSGEYYFYYHDLKSLLDLLPKLPKKARVSDELENALHHIHTEALFRERDCEGKFDIGEIVMRHLDRKWKKDDRAFVDTFVEVLHGSMAYWEYDPEGMRRLAARRLVGRRPRLWVTILADAIGGAIGGAAGAAAGGPAGAAIGAGLLGGVFSGVFS